MVIWNRNKPHGRQQICESLCIANVRCYRNVDHQGKRLFVHHINTPRNQLQNKHRSLTKWQSENCVNLFNVITNTSAPKVNLDIPWLLPRAGHVPTMQLTAGLFTLNQQSKEIKVYNGESCTWQYPTTLLWCPYASRTLYKGFCRHGSAVFRNCTLSGNVLCKSVDKVLV